MKSTLFKQAVSKMNQLSSLLPSRALRSTRVINREFSSMFSNRQVRLAARPVGMPRAEDWKITEEALTLPPGDVDKGQGSFVVKTSYLSLDPAMRGWMREGKSYIPPVAIGDVMRAGGSGIVVASNNDKFQVGDSVSGMLNAQEYAIFNDNTRKAAGIRKIDLNMGTHPQWLNALGMPGMTAYFGLMDVGKPEAGQTLVVSSALGAVGQLVGQLGKLKGMNVIGIAGGTEKCDLVVKEFGFDACIDYKKPIKSFYSDLKQYASNGVDIYFDNVGGEILDCVLTRINYRARIVICGAISQYNAEGGIEGPKNYLSLLVNRARMEGMVVFDYAKQYPIAISEISGHLKSGSIKSLEDIVSGRIDKFPDTLNMLFSGKNIGKLILKVENPKV